MEEVNRPHGLSGVVLPSGKQIAEDIEVVLHGLSAVCYSSATLRKMLVHRLTGNFSMAAIVKLPVADPAMLARYHIHGWLSFSLLIAYAAHLLRHAFPIRNDGRFPRGLTPPALGAMHGAWSTTK